MPEEYRHPPETDLDKTDELPILKDVVLDFDDEEDAQFDRTAVLPDPQPRAAAGTPDFVRPAAVDRPSLQESVRSVEERISRQQAQYEALTRAYARARDAESASAERANALVAELAAARAALGESERRQGESRTLRDSLSARDATVAQALHSLGERDAQLAALQAEHAKIVPALEAASKSASRLGLELQASRAQAKALAAQLQSARETAAALGAQVGRGESEVNAARSELGAARIQASSYLELLQTREWRLGFDLNMFRELDAQAGAVHAGPRALEPERGRLAGQGSSLEARLAEQAAQIARLQSEAQTHEQEMTALMAHLKEARRPIQSIEADIKRLTEELGVKNAACAASDEENRNLRAALERTRGALEEREALIRRLERSKSSNANVLGRIQTSIERLGSVPVGPNAAAAQVPAADWSAELTRMDGERTVTHVLSRRTRIGRAFGCELQIDSSSVSRHHALIVAGPVEAVIEDLNSTNGVLVNGRKVMRQPLCDGDTITIGETQFRYSERPLHPPPEPDPAETVPKA